MVHVLIVEDEIHLAKTMSDYLEQEQFLTTVLERGDEVMPFLAQNQIDVVLLDLMLPGLNGIEVCKSIRQQNTTLPIIMTTARVDEIDRILGLEIGANDYVCKPYSPRELVARVKVQLRQVNPTQIQPLISNDKDMTVEHLGKQVQLTLVEYKLLTKMMAQPGRIFNRDQLMDAIYDDGRIVTDRTIDSHIKKIRQKLKAVSAKHNFILAIYGCGYKFINDAL